MWMEEWEWSFAGQRGRFWINEIIHKSRDWIFSSSDSQSQWATAFWSSVSEDRMINPRQISPWLPGHHAVSYHGAWTRCRLEGFWLYPQDTHAMVSFPSIAKETQKKIKGSLFLLFFIIISENSQTSSFVQVCLFPLAKGVGKDFWNLRVWQQGQVPSTLTTAGDTAPWSCGEISLQMLTVTGPTAV